MADWLRTPVHIVGLIVVSALVTTLFRDLFVHGKVMLPDLFIGAPAVASYDWLDAYLWRWTPAFLGSESALPWYFGIEGILTHMGVLGPALQAILLVPLVTLSGLTVWLLAERFVKNPWIALLAPVTYLVGPNLFELVFDGSSDFFLYALLPILAWLTWAIVQKPTWRRGVALGLVIGLNSAFEPFAPILTLPFVVTFAGSLLLIRPTSRSSLYAAGLILFAYALGLLLNASYYIGNLDYLTTAGVAGAFEAEIPVVMSTYSGSGPVNLLSLLGGSLYGRYLGFYAGWAVALLLVVPALATLALAQPRAGRDGELRLALGAEVLVSVIWVTATRLGLTLGLFQAVPYLLVFNYPQAFYLFLGLPWALLATFAVDDLAEVATSAQRRLEPSSPTESAGPAAETRMLWLSERLRRNAWWAAAVLLVIAVAAPAGFYLATGDMRIDAAPAAAGFPPAWGPHEPASFAEIARFLAAHGGDSNARILMLPAAAFAGGGTLPGYSMNLFNQPEYTGGYTGPFFATAASEEYATDVLNYLVSNRTDHIGIPLGVASVRWIVVDRELNFTGPPRWYLGSLVGDPSRFQALLEGQEDLSVAFQDPSLTIYENHEYWPYIQEYAGITLVRVGQPGIIPIREVYTWPMESGNWTLPASPSSLSSVVPIRSGNATAVEGYLVTGTGETGNMTVRFSANGSGGSLTSQSSQFDAGPVYMTSGLVPVADQEYSVQYVLDYEGPARHEGGFLFLAGSDARGGFLWQTAFCCSGAAGRQTLRVSVDPYLEDPRTAFIQAAVVFPYRFGAGATTTMAVTNLTLGIRPRPPAPDTLGPLFLPQLPSTYVGSADAAALDRDLSASDRSRLNASGVLDGTLCLGVCTGAAPAGAAQLIMAYDSLAFPSAASMPHRDPRAISGTSLEVGGPAEANLSLTAASYQTVYLRARGAGSVTLALPSGASQTFTVSNETFAWYAWELTSPVSETTVHVNVTGTPWIDAILLADAPGGGSSGTAMNGLTFSRDSPVEYRGTSASPPRVLVLSQGFNTGWELQGSGERIAPVPVFGWANGFPVPHTIAGQTSWPFVVVFTRQGEQEVLIGVEISALVVAVSFAGWPAFRKSWRWLRGQFAKGGPKHA